MKTLVLASASPRRLELLEKAGHRVSVHPSHVSEKIEKNLIPDQLVLHLAELKARSSAQTLDPSHPTGIVIGADTEVFFRDQRMGKPRCLDEAVETLCRLSGQVHDVRTGVCLFQPKSGLYRTFVESTRVRWNPISRKEIEDYVQAFRPLDKAGSYGIQEIPETFVASIEGSRSNVMGLPMEAFEKNLVQFRWECLHKLLPESCRLLAVSKKQSLEKMRWVFEMGQRDFAENYVQEALSKMQSLQGLPIRWHFIGHLQKNKVQQVLGLFDCIQSVDSRDLIERIQRCAQERGLVQKIFLQVNLANEKSKKGFSVEELRQVLQESARLSNLEIAGLMTFPPLQDPELNRIYFRQLRELRNELQKTQPQLKDLSMGTSEDFEIAIEEGSTDVRLGSVLFGDRT